MTYTRVFAASFLFILSLMSATTKTARAQSHEVRSPDGRLVVTVQTGGDQLTYAVEHAGRALVEPSPISMTLAEGPVLGQTPAVQDTARRRVDRVLHPVLRVKSATIDDRFNELRIDFEKDFALVVRAYDDGAAYRFETQLPDTITVADEEATFALADGRSAGYEPPVFYWARDDGEARGEPFITHSESYY